MLFNKFIGTIYIYSTCTWSCKLETRMTMQTIHANITKVRREIEIDDLYLYTIIIKAYSLWGRVLLKINSYYRITESKLLNYTKYIERNTHVC